jgi:hypothetical protein
VACTCRYRLTVGLKDRWRAGNLQPTRRLGSIASGCYCSSTPAFWQALCSVGSHTAISSCFRQTIIGIFGGVLGSTVFAITTDLCRVSDARTRDGLLQTSFAASSIIGVPLGLYVSGRWSRNAPFLMIVFRSAYWSACPRTCKRRVWKVNFYGRLNVQLLLAHAFPNSNMTHYDNSKRRNHTHCNRRGPSLSGTHSA